MNRNQLIQDLRSMGLVVSNAPMQSNSLGYGVISPLNVGGDRVIANCIKATADAGNYHVVYALTYTIEPHEDPTINEADWQQFVHVHVQLRTRL